VERGIVEGGTPWGISVLRLSIGRRAATCLLFGFGCGLLVEGFVTLLLYICISEGLWQGTVWSLAQSN
jgi:hypothetical protein